ncbi:MAG TPA: efflux RND transporter permease subunit [Acidobacteriota bacterium]|nr:efflux RND transporter permease subunit [Acidobacteriota bacterium]
MQKLAEICIRRPVFASMIILALVVVGAAGYYRLGIDRFPSVDLPTVLVRTVLPGASPEETETQVSRIIEEAVNTVEGIYELRSISGPGSSIVIATFNLNRDIDTAAQDVRDRVSGVLRDLPDNAEPPLIFKNDNDSTPVLTIALSGDRQVRELTEIADKIVKVQLERSSGVGDVEIVGGLERTINIWVDADRLAAYQIPITRVRDALVRQNADLPGGNVTEGPREETLRTMGRYIDPREFNDLTIATINGVPLRVRDIGWAEDGSREQRSLSRLNGVPTVTLEVRRQSGANSIAVIEAAKQSLEKVKSQIPPDIRVEVIRDQSRYIYAALHEINIHLIVGSILASLVVLLFMRSWRSTFIAAIAIPTSVISTFGMMWALHFTLNSVTMLALVLMVGIVIDDAIVVLENIFRFVEEKKMTPRQAAVEATREIGMAVMATTFSLVVIFVPVSFMSSISGRFLYQFGITAAVAVMVSLLVSFTLTPMMGARLLRKEDIEAQEFTEAESRKGFYAWLDNTYSRLLVYSLAHRKLILATAFVIVLSSIPLYHLVKQEYIPTNVDEAEFDVNFTAPEGVSISAMDEVSRSIEKDLRAIPGVRLILSSVGGSFLGNVNQGSIYVRIAPHDERIFSIPRFFSSLLKGDPLGAFRGNYSQKDVMIRVRQALQKYPDLRTSVRNAPSFNIGGGSWEIDFVLRGPDLEALAGYAEQLRKKSLNMGIIDADITLKLDKPELRVEIDRARAADLGVDAEEIANALRLMVGGDQKVSRYRDPAADEEYDVQLRLSDRDRNNAATLGQLFVRGRNDSLVRLDNVVRIVPARTASRIDRLDRQRQVSLRASVAPGYALADRLEALREAAREMNLPPAYSTSISGRGRELERTFSEFLWAFLLSVIFMYMILASQFESTIHPLTILLSLPLSVPFALFSLWITGNTLNLYSALGILVLFGVVKKNAILQIDHMNQLRAKGMERTAAILQANRDRLRPILMTTLSLVAGMLPLAVGTGPGAEERRAIAVVVIGGQTLCLLLTLLVTPTAYAALDDLSGLRLWSRAKERFASRRKQAWINGSTKAD